MKPVVLLVPAVVLLTVASAPLWASADGPAPVEQKVERSVAPEGASTDTTPTPEGTAAGEAYEGPGTDTAPTPEGAAAGEGYEGPGTE